VQTSSGAPTGQLDTGQGTLDTGHWTTAGCGEVDEIAMAI